MKLKVLIVEDDETTALYLKEVVSNFSKKILYATNGIKGLTYFKNHPDIDLILMDIKLPGIDGYEVTRQIRRYNKKVIIIAQTAYAHSTDRNKALEAGCNEYIAKPVFKKDLLKLISNFFRITSL
ncbi:MAG: response regulator [Lutibacter sp.]|uniref:response regulator n=1 Tax=Lutibacter sp. TaxID=1925666 RepID=UPI00385F9248